MLTFVWKCGKYFVSLQKHKFMERYKNLEEVGITQADVANALGYASPGCFRSSSAKTRIMKGVDELIGKAMAKVKAELKLKLGI